jgi:hypothetical protein
MRDVCSEDFSPFSRGRTRVPYKYAFIQGNQPDIIGFRIAHRGQEVKGTREIFPFLRGDSRSWPLN